MLVKADLDALLEVDDVGPIVAEHILSFFAEPHNQNIIDGLLKIGINWPVIEKKDESELPFIAKSVISGMFLANDDSIKALYQKAFKQISESNNTEAIQNVTEDMIVKGNQYKGFNFDKVMINLMRNMVNDQKKVNKTNKERNIVIIKTAMAKLL